MSFWDVFYALLDVPLVVIGTIGLAHLLEKRESLPAWAAGIGGAYAALHLLFDGPLALAASITAVWVGGRLCTLGWRVILPIHRWWLMGAIAAAIVGAVAANQILWNLQAVWVLAIAVVAHWFGITLPIQAVLVKVRDLIAPPPPPSAT